MAVVQLSAGGFGFGTEVLSGGQRPWIILASLVLLGAIPYTLALDALRRR